MMEREISETYFFDENSFGPNGCRISDGSTFREVVKGFEKDFHKKHNSEYALNMYANAWTMDLLAKSCHAETFLSYGMDLTQGGHFDALCDPEANHNMDLFSKSIFVYGIDSAYMTDFDKDGYPIFGDGIYPLTLLVDSNMRNGELRLATPTDESNDEFEINKVQNPEYELA